MLRNKFQHELDALNQDMINMGSLVEQSIENSLKALMTQDKDLCEQVIVSDKEINKHMTNIESRALKILLMQQPVASDLRTISTALKMVGDLERIGDQASDICEIVNHLCNEDYQPTLDILPQMGELAKKMVNSCIDSFVKLDTEIADKVIATDDDMDAFFEQIREKMIAMIKEKPMYADQAIYFTMVGKYFEKIGDYAESIARWVKFLQSGEHKNVKII